MAKATIRAMRLADYARVRAIWKKTEGMCLEPDDSLDGIRLYLARNKGLCFVAVAGRRVVGAVLCGHDGRRAILRHLAVVPAHRRMGIGRALVSRSLAALGAQGISRCNLFVMKDNPLGLRYWEGLGCKRLRDNYRTLQIGTGRIGG